MTVPRDGVAAAGAASVIDAPTTALVTSADKPTAVISATKSADPARLEKRSILRRSQHAGVFSGDCHGLPPFTERDAYQADTAPRVRSCRGEHRT